MNEPHRAWRGHDFWPSADVLAAIPALDATEFVGEREKVVHLHYFVGGCDWWVVELDPGERLAFGYVCLGDPQMAEWGYIPLDELAEVFRAPSFGDPPARQGDRYHPAADRRTRPGVDAAAGGGGDRLPLACGRQPCPEVGGARRVRWRSPGSPVMPCNDEPPQRIS